MVVRNGLISLLISIHIVCGISNILLRIAATNNE